MNYWGIVDFVNRAETGIAEEAGGDRGGRKTRDKPRHANHTPVNKTSRYLKELVKLLYYVSNDWS